MGKVGSKLAQLAAGLRSVRLTDAIGKVFESETAFDEVRAEKGDSRFAIGIGSAEDRLLRHHGALLKLLSGNGLMFPPGAAGFVGGNVCLVLERETNVVETIEEAVAAERVDRERGVEVAGVSNGLLVEVDGEPVARNRLRVAHERSDLIVGKGDGEHAILEAVVVEDVGIGGGDNRAEAIVVKGPRSVFPRGATAEVMAGDEDGGAVVARLVELEVRIERAIVEITPVVEKEWAVASALNALEELFGNDLVSIDIDAVERSNEALEADEWFHW